MIRALLAGKKSQTRRLSARWDRVQVGDVLWCRETWVHYQSVLTIRRHDGASCNEVSDGSAAYRADFHPDDTIEDVREHLRSSHGIGECVAVEINGDRWRSPLHMPKWASRITLRVTAPVRMEPVQAITDADVRAEGLTEDDFRRGRPWLHPHDVEVHTYGALWDDLHKKLGERWDDNPTVRVLTFEVVT